MEEFRDIKGYEGLYQISDLGRVKSLERPVRCKAGGFRTVKERILNSKANKSGYLLVTLSVRDKKESKSIHQLVASAFIEKKTIISDLVVDHKDNNKLNNNKSNLQLITPRHNSSKDRKGTSKYTGVCWHKKSKKWCASIQIKGKAVWLGVFFDELSASKTYQKALIDITART